MNKLCLVWRILSFTLVIAVLGSCGNSAETPVTSEFPRLQTASPQSSPSASPADIKETGEERVLTLAFESSKSIEEDIIYILAQKYMALNPGVVFKFEYTSSELINNYVGYTKGLVKHNFGRGPDIIRFPAAFLYASYTLKEVFRFVDLREIMEKDSRFDEDDYFMNIFEACADEQGLYFVPLSFSFDYVAVNKKYSDLVEGYTDSDGKININQMFQVYKDAWLRYQDARPANSSPEIYMNDYSKNNMFFAAAFDLDSVDTAKAVFEFNTEENKKLAAELSILPKLPDTASRSAAAAFYPVEEVLFATSSNILSNPANALMKYRESVFGTPLLLTGENGYASFTYSDSFAINANCEDKELAWDFLKFCLNTPPQNEGESITVPYTGIYGKYPVSRKLFEAAVTSDIEKQFDLNDSNGFASVESKMTAIDNAVTKFTEMAESVNMINLYQRINVHMPVYLAEKSYIEGKISIDEFVEKLEGIIGNAIADGLGE